MFIIKLPYDAYLLNGLRDTKDIDKAKRFETKKQAIAYTDTQCPRGCKIIEVEK